MDPLEVTKFDRTDKELERFWIFCILVAGKNADTASRVVERLCAKCPEAAPLLSWLANDHLLHNALVAARSGQYTRIERAIKESAKLNLRTCTLEDLMIIHGVGPKTARFFLVHSRRDAKHAILDVHILKWLREHGVGDAPQQTPSGRLYNTLENTYLSIVNVLYPNVPLAEIDLMIWAQQSGRLQNDPTFEPVLPGE